MRKRTALIAGGVATSVAAGAIAAGAVGRTVLRRRSEHSGSEGPWCDLPPDDLGPVRSFDGTLLAVRAAGDPEAPMLLFVHGFSLDMTTWREQWVDLSADYRCVLMDHRGHGASEHPSDGDLSVRSMARDISAVLDEVAPGRRVVIVGHSMGAIAALAMAEVRPDLMTTSVAGLCSWERRPRSWCAVRWARSPNSCGRDSVRSCLPPGGSTGCARRCSRARPTCVERSCA